MLCAVKRMNALAKFPGAQTNSSMRFQLDSFARCALGRAVKLRRLLLAYYDERPLHD
jgi:hypothetical protein